jgi:hypothetical protein
MSDPSPTAALVSPPLAAVCVAAVAASAAPQPLLQPPPPIVDDEESVHSSHDIHPPQDVTMSSSSSPPSPSRSPPLPAAVLPAPAENGSGKATVPASSSAEADDEISAKSLAALARASAPSLGAAQIHASAPGCRDNTNKHPHSTNSAPTSEVEQAMLTATPPSVPPPAPQPSPAPSSSSLLAASGDGRDLEKFGEPAALSSAAVVAPAADPATLSTASSSSSLTDGAAPGHRDAALPHPEEEAEEKGQGQDSEKNNSEKNSEKNSKKYFSGNSSLDQLGVQLSKLVAESKLNPRQESAAAPIDLKIQCLVVDPAHPSVASADSADGKNYKEALDLALRKDSSRDAKMAALKTRVNQWLPSLQIASVYAIDKHLHISLLSHDALADALLAHTFLQRCCGSPSGWSRGAKPCNGVSKSELPELLLLSCRFNSLAEKQQVKTEDVKIFLAQVMQLQYCTFWMANQQGKEASPHLSIFVLPRIVRIPALAAEVTRAHEQFSLHGAQVRVQGINSRELLRCSECGHLGHVASNCNIYSGVAIRLLSSKHYSFSYHTMSDLVARSKSRNAFLGSKVEMTAPSHRLTLIYDAEAWKQAEVQRALMQIVAELQASKQLHEDPRVVDVKLRSRECEECGSTQRPHACPFLNGYVAKPKPNVAAAAVAAAKKPSAASAAAVQDKMCRAWRKTKKCQHKDKCKFEHPDSHVAEQVCHQFQRNGSCLTDGCTFRHEQPAAVAPPSSVVLAPPPPPPPPPPPAPQQPAPVQPAPVQPAAAASVSPAATAAAAPPSLRRKRGLEQSSSSNENSFQILALEEEDSEKSESAQAESAAAASPRRSKSTAAPASSPAKKQRAAAASSEAASSEDSDMSASQPPPPVSSLSFFASPSRGLSVPSSAASKSSKKKKFNKQ